MNYIDIENIRVGDVYCCGKSHVEIVAMNLTMQHFTIRFPTGNRYKVSAKALDYLLNPSVEESA